MKKKFLKVMACLMIMLIIASMPFSVFAVSFDQLNSSNVFLKQAGSTTCTLCSATMMLRRYSMLRGDSDWSSITESSVRNSAWVNGTGLRWSFSYSNSSVGSISVGHYTLPGGTANESKIQQELKNCPEGIVIYNESVPHAVLLTDYTNGVYYCADPLRSSPSGRIPLDSSYYVRLTNVTAYWKVTSPVVPGPTDHTHNYTTRLYESEHPHRISERCQDYATCGGWRWTDEYYTDRECSKCWSLKITPSVSSLSFEVGKTGTLKFNVSGVYPSNSKVYFEYDTSILEYSSSNGTFTLKGLKEEQHILRLKHIRVIKRLRELYL